MNNCLNQYKRMYGNMYVGMHLRMIDAENILRRIE